MKKLIALCSAALMTACPVACVNDPTESDEVCTDTTVEDETSCLEDVESTEVVVEETTEVEAE